MKCTDTYKEERVIELPGMIIRVHIPDITEEERQRRLKFVYEAAANLLKSREGARNESKNTESVQFA